MEKEWMSLNIFERVNIFISGLFINKSYMSSQHAWFLKNKSLAEYTYILLLQKKTHTAHASSDLKWQT